MIGLQSVITASQQQIACDLGDEAVILNLKSGEYYGLDPVGARIWSWLRTPQVVQQLRDRLVQDYKVDPGQLERDLFALLAELADEGLIEVTVGTEQGT